MGEGGESLGRQAGLKTRRIGGTVDPLRFSIFWQIFVPAAVWFGLVGSLAGLAVGAGLLARSEGTLKLLRSMNRWVSTRRVLKPLEIPRRIEPIAAGNRRWLALLVLAGGAIALLVLVASYGDFRGVIRLGRLRTSPAAVAVGMAVESLYVVLAVGSAAAVAAGILLAFFPRAWSAIEARANRWYSARQLGARASAMHFTLDALAENHPRAAGWTISIGSLLAAIVFGILAFVRP